MTIDSPANLATIKTLAAKEAISLNGLMPNQWEPTGVSRFSWNQEHVQQVDLCRAYIRATLRETLPSRTWCRMSSYGFKHIVERECGTYICNGSFIVAAFLEGLSCEERRHQCLFPQTANQTRRQQIKAAHSRQGYASDTPQELTPDQFAGIPLCVPAQPVSAPRRV